MQRINRYIERFNKERCISRRYEMSSTEWLRLSKMACHSSEEALDATNLAFNYGYAKGYRACQADRKSNGGCR